MPNWIEAGQRIKRMEPFVMGRIWSSGYLVADNGIDIEDAFIMIRLPFAHEWQYNLACDSYEWGIVCWLYRRTKGWELRFDFNTGGKP